MRFLTILLIIFSQTARAQKVTKIGELKGIDFKFGFTSFGLSSQDASKIFSDIVSPDLGKNNIQTKGFINGKATNINNYFYLGLSSKNKWFTTSRVLKNSENRFGISYGSFNDAITSDVVFESGGTTSELLSGNGIIKYDGYGVNADYTVNSKPFFKDFAVYLSLGTAVVLHNYTVINRNGFLSREEPSLATYPSIVLINKKTSMTSVDIKVFLGLKYNLSCDFNLFLEIVSGGSFYPKGLSVKNKLLPFSQITAIGIRYKFVDPENKTKTKSSVFW